MVTAVKNVSDKCAPYTEVVTQALAHGASAVARMEPAPTRRTIVKAIDELRRLRRGDVADHMEKAFLPHGRARGKPPPRPGDEKKYKVQFTEGLDFVRIPTRPLGATRALGSTVRVQFKDDRIVITRSPGEPDARDARAAQVDDGSDT